MPLSTIKTNLSAAGVWFSALFLIAALPASAQSNSTGLPTSCPGLAKREACQSQLPLTAGDWFLISTPGGGTATPYVVTLQIPINVTEAGELIVPQVDCTRSSRGPVSVTDQNGNSWTYPGYSKAAYFAPSSLFLTAQNPLYVDPATGKQPNLLYTFGQGVALTPQSGEDGWANQPADREYYRDRIGQPYVTQASDIGQRYLIYVTWVSSDPATTADWIEVEPYQCWMTTLVDAP